MQKRLIAVIILFSIPIGIHVKALSSNMVEVIDEGYLYVTGDVNADGQSDFAELDGDFVNLYLSNSSIPDLRLYPSNYEVSGEFQLCPPNDVMVGDFNGDEYNDIAVSHLLYNIFHSYLSEMITFIYRGGLELDSIPDKHFISGECYPIKDMDGDSCDEIFYYSDVGIGRYWERYLWHLGYESDSLKGTLTGDYDMSFLWSQILDIGDLNKDGFNDIIINVPFSDTNIVNSPYQGKIYLQYGANNVQFDFSKMKTFDIISCLIGSPGDVNGDGYNDFCYSDADSIINGYTPIAGNIKVISGKSFDCLLEINTGNYEKLIRSVCGGDIDNDGYSDIFIGLGKESEPGSPFKADYLPVISKVYFGGKNMDSIPDIEISAVTNTPFVTKKIEYLGDFNRDNYNEFVITGEEEGAIKSYVFSYINITGIKNDDNRNCLMNTVMTGNYPNPFNNSTLIEYSLPVSMHAEIKVYNMKGQEITTLVNDFQTAGKHQIKWHPDNDLSSGIYFYRLTAGEFTKTRKFILQK